MWAELKGFTDWLRRNGPLLTNQECVAEIERRWQQPVTVNAVVSLRRTYGGQMTPETRRRAYDKRLGSHTEPIAGRAPDVQQLAELRAANLALLRRIEAERVTKQELVDAVYRAALTAAQAFTLPAVPPPVKDGRKDKVPETAVAILADWQLGKRTATYNSDVCAQRIASRTRAAAGSRAARRRCRSASAG